MTENGTLEALEALLKETLLNAEIIKNTYGTDLNGMAEDSLEHLKKDLHALQASSTFALGYAKKLGGK